MNKLRKWSKWLVVAAATAVTPLAFAADHQDSDAVKTDPSSDITDIYSWMQNGKLVMALDVFPLADTNSKFSDVVQYVLHTKSGSNPLAPDQPEVNVICLFDTAQKAKCWVGDKEYVEGDASQTAGLASADGKFKVFAGLRDDPFFFNLDGFKHTVTIVEGAAGSLTFNAFGCPNIDAATSGVLVSSLMSDATGTNPGTDFFGGKNVLSIVVEVDPSLVSSATSPIVTFWASTNKAN